MTGADQTVVDIRHVLEAFIDVLQLATRLDKPVVLRFRSESHQLHIRRAVAVGILANELVQMALRHAFPGDSA